MTSAPPIGFEYRPAWLPILLAGVVLALASLAVLASALPDAARFGVPPILVAWGIWRLWRRVHSPVHAVLWRSDGGVTLTLRAGAGRGTDAVEARLLQARVLGPLIVLALNWPPRQRETLWLLPANLDADTRRHLRIRIGAGVPDTPV